jgi:hypothetical protein
MAQSEKICTNCGYVGYEARRNDPVQILLLVLLLLLFIVPGIAYLIYVVRGSKMCPKCKSRKMIPLDTPLGQKLLTETRGPHVQAEPRFRNKVEYQAWKASQDLTERE